MLSWLLFKNENLDTVRDGWTQIDRLAQSPFLAPVRDSIVDELISLPSGPTSCETSSPKIVASTASAPDGFVRTCPIFRDLAFEPGAYVFRPSGSQVSVIVHEISHKSPLATLDPVKPTEGETWKHVLGRLETYGRGDSAANWEFQLDLFMESLEVGSIVDEEEWPTVPPAA
ncbi:MAG: hypothetical protein HY791_08110 [Deltaproteobacteria bacterium]|nr:hypothetical protein [Deltaproteobacteria bacterium]